MVMNRLPATFRQSDQRFTRLLEMISDLTTCRTAFIALQALCGVAQEELVTLFNDFTALEKINRHPLYSWGETNLRPPTASGHAPSNKTRDSWSRQSSMQ